MKKFDDWISKFTTLQKLLFLIFVPFGILLLGELTFGVDNDDIFIWHICIIVIIGYKLFISKIEKWISNLNSQQKFVLSIVIPFGLGILFYPIAEHFDNRSGYNPFFFKETWPVWFIYVILIGLIEFKLFGNKKP